MNKRTIKTALKGLSSTLKKHSPEILTGIGIAGMIATTVSAVRATPKALRMVDKREIEEDRRLKPVEVIQTTWKCYIPAMITGTLSAACLVGASSVNLRRNAALATAYTLSETALRDYQNKALEVIGEKKEQEIRDAIAKDQLEKNPLPADKQVIPLSDEEYWCFDPLSHRYFKSTKKALTDAELALNRQMRDEMVITLNDFYIALDQEPDDPSVGDRLGWSIDGNGYVNLDLYWSERGTPDGKPCIVIGHRNPPVYIVR